MGVEVTTSASSTVQYHLTAASRLRVRSTAWANFAGATRRVAPLVRVSFDSIAIPPDYSSARIGRGARPYKPQESARSRGRARVARQACGDACGPRTRWPGIAPVGSPSINVTSPDTTLNL